jgi:hypothetical protein
MSGGRFDCLVASRGDHPLRVLAHTALQHASPLVIGLPITISRGMSRSSEDVTAPFTEEVAFLRLLTELEKAAHIDWARFTPNATASICERLRKLAADMSVEGDGAVWHP